MSAPDTKISRDEARYKLESAFSEYLREVRPYVELSEQHQAELINVCIEFLTLKAYVIPLCGGCGKCLDCLRTERELTG